MIFMIGECIESQRCCPFVFVESELALHDILYFYNKYVSL